MADKQKEAEVVTINNVEYKVDDLSDKAKALINHVGDLQRKMGNLTFQLDQMQLGLDMAGKLLTEELEEPESEVKQLAS